MLPITITPSTYILSDEERSFISSLEYNYVPINNNFLSKDYYVLENPQLSSLKQEIEKHIENYRVTICGISEKLKLTQSWIAKTEVGGHHDLHKHHNSLFSGVFYIECSDNSPLRFYHDNYLLRDFKFVLNYTHSTGYNSSRSDVYAKTNDVVIFPSWIDHDVDKNPGPKQRIVLAFNTFVHGELGNNNFFPAGLKIN